MGNNLQSCYVGHCNITNICLQTEIIILNQTHCDSVKNTSLSPGLEASSCHLLENEFCQDLHVHKEKPATRVELNYDIDGCYDLSDLEHYKYYEDQLVFMKYLGVIAMGQSITYSTSDMIERLAGIGILGIIGNLLSIIVLNTKEMRTNCFNNLLTALNVAER